MPSQAASISVNPMAVINANNPGVKMFDTMQALAACRFSETNRTVMIKFSHVAVDVGRSILAYQYEFCGLLPPVQ
jgi:hypothetical protein